MIAALLKTGNTLARRIDYAFLFLCVYVLLINITYFLPSFVPRHDSMAGFEIFYYFYNEYFYHGEIAQWVFYEFFGFPAGPYQVGSFTPICYLFCVIGKACGIQDVMLIFKFSIFFDQLIFLAGLYFLTKLFFKEWLVVVLVGISAFCSLEWTYQLGFNFRLYYLFPWVFYFIVLFFQRRRPLFLWTAGIFGIFWMYGSWYFVFLWIFLLFILCSALLMYDRSIVKVFWPLRLPDAAAMAVFFIFAGIFSFFIKNSFNGLTSLSRPEGMANSLATFLSYGGTASLHSAISWLFYGWPARITPDFSTIYDNTAYVSLAAAFFFVWAVIFVRNKYFLALLAGIVALIVLSTGGIFAQLIYYFPGMKYFRHISLIYSLIKILVAIGSGFGLSHFLQCASPLRFNRVLTVAMVCFILLAVSLAGEQGLSTADGKRVFLLRYSIYSSAFFLWLLFYSVARIISRTNPHVRLAMLPKSLFGLFLIVAVLADAFLFQRMLHDSTPLASERAIHAFQEAAGVHKPEFMMRRVLFPSTERQKLIFSLEEEIKRFPTAKYDSILNFAQMDRCDVGRSFGAVVKDVKVLLDSKAEGRLGWSNVRDCQTPKIQLLKKDLSMEDGGEILLQGRSAVEQKRLVGAQGDIRVERFSANKLFLDVNVKEREGAWLVYLDSYHQGWHAYLDGVNVPINKACAAFKAIFIPKGAHKIHFMFFNGLTSTLSYVVAFIGVLAGAVFFLLIFVAFFRFRG